VAATDDRSPTRVQRSGDPLEAPTFGATGEDPTDKLVLEGLELVLPV